jgi:hypothetical protein
MTLIKNPFQDGLGRTTLTLDHVVVVHILIRDNRKSQINEYSDISVMFYFVNDENII